MAKLVLFMGVTLDGYVAGPNGEHDWSQPPEDEELVEEVAALKGASGGELELAHARRFDCGRIFHTYRNASRAG